MSLWRVARSFFSPAMVIVVGRSAGLVAAFCIPLVLARVFDQTEFGTYKQLFLIYGTLFGLAQFGMAESLYYFVPRQPQAAGRQIANAMASLALAGVACLGLLFFGRHLIARWMANPQLADYLLPLGVMLAMMLTAAVYEIVLISRKAHVAAARAYGVSDLFRAMFLVVPAAMLWGLRGVMIGAATFAALRLAVVTFALWRQFRSGMAIDAPQWRLQLAYAVPFSIAVGIEVLQINWHQYVVASRFDAATFAIYAVGCLQIPLVDLVVTSTNSVMMVDMAEGVSAHDDRAAVTLWHDTIGRLALLIIPLAVVLIVMAHDIIGVLYPPAYAASVPIFMLWSLTIVASILVVDSVLRVYAQTRFLLVLNTIHFIVVAALAGPFLTMFGLRGAVLISLLATAIVKSVAVVRIAQLMNVPVERALPWDRLGTAAVCALVAAIPAFAVTRAFVMPPLVSLIAGTAVYGLAYLSVVRLLLGEDVQRTLIPSPSSSQAR
jgi:O-antigen/teichoic acid export membrane protein